MQLLLILRVQFSEGIANSRKSMKRTQLKKKVSGYEEKKEDGYAFSNAGFK